MSMPAAHVAPRVRRTWLLALGDTLTAGMGLGYLAHQYREALVANSAAIGLGAVAVLCAALLLRASVRVLRRATMRIDAIFSDELRDKPSPRPR
jgi:ABC-type nitrate/sulfonate/bicarbonate transport system permease component